MLRHIVKEREKYESQEEKFLEKGKTKKILVLRCIRDEKEDKERWWLEREI